MVGSGSIGRRHVRIIRRLMPSAEVACVSASGRLLSSLETEATVILSSLDEAVTWRPDLVVVASPAPLHLGHAAQFLAGCARILIEKPLTDRLSRGLEVAEQFAASPSKVEVGYNLRYLPALVELKRRIEMGELGRLHHIRIESGHYLPDWRKGSDYRENVSANRELGGGALLELSHELDYLTWIFGQFDLAYCISSNSGQLEIDVEDRVDITLSRSDGLVAQIHLDFLQREPCRYCKIIGEAGALYLDVAMNSLSLLRGEGQEILVASTENQIEKTYADQLKAILSEARQKNKPNIPFEQGLYIVRLIECLKRSAQTGKPVPIK